MCSPAGLGCCSASRPISRRVSIRRSSPHVVTLATLVIGCSADRGNTPLDLVCTTGAVGDLVGHIVGSNGVVTTLVGPNDDPHTFVPTAEDERRLVRADVVFKVGLGLEKGMAEAFGRLPANTKVVELGHGIPEQLIRMKGGAPDPHLWLDVTMWKEAVAPVVVGVSQVDSDRFGDYKLNGERFRARLDTLDAWVRQEVGKVASDRRFLITAHDAFGYFGAAYGFYAAGVRGTSPSRAPNESQIGRIVDIMARRDAAGVFADSNISDTDLARMVARGIRVLESDSLKVGVVGAGGEETYVGGFRSTVTTIVEAMTKHGSQN